MCYLVIVVAIGLGQPAIIRSATETRASQQDHDLLGAFHLAEAGLDVARRQLRTSGSNTAIGSTRLGDGTYQATIDVNGTLRTIRATGTVNSFSRAIEEVVQVTPPNSHPYAVFAEAALVVEGSSLNVYGYQSSLGLARSLDTRAGDIRTNRLTDDGATLEGSINIGGRAVSGQGSDPQRVYKREGSVVITGGLTAATAAHTVTIPSRADSCVELGNAEGDLIITDATQFLTGPCYYVRRNVKLSGTSTLAFTSLQPVKVYVDGWIKLEGTSSVEAPSGRPTNLTVYATGPDPGLRGQEEVVKITGTSNVEATIVAERGSIKFVGGSSNVYGALTSKTGNVKIEGMSMNLYYDKELNGSSDGSGPNTITTRVWNQL